MFAVKGWAVDANSLTPQTQPFSASASSKNGDSQQVLGKKRKRGNPRPSTNEDIASLWERHIEGKPKAKPNMQTQKKVKKRKLVELEEWIDEQNAQTYPGKEASSKIEEVKAKRESSVDGQRSKSLPKVDRLKAQNSEMDQSRSIEIQRNMPLPTAVKLTPMQSAMHQKLVSARFRHLNQTLYTESSAKALELFDSNPAMFEDYHAGFRQQVSMWPENPVDDFLTTLRARGNIRPNYKKRGFHDKKRRSKEEKEGSTLLLQLPRTHGTCYIADLGCGDARLAQILRHSGDEQKMNLKVLSYDLHSPSPLVTKADISHIPTGDGTVDIAIFCLALMGTNWISFVEEAYRILHWKGELWVAEIKSRFGRVSKAGKPVEHSIGGKRKQAVLKKAQLVRAREKEELNEVQTLEAEVDGVETKDEGTDVSAFVDVLQKRGFLLKHGPSSVDLKNKMFVKMEFVKAATPTKGAHATKQDSQAPAKFKSKAAFLGEDADEPTTEDEAKVLKPCLYKLR